MAKKQPGKVRTERLGFTTVDKISKLKLTYDHLKGCIEFGDKVENVYSEVTYDRPSKSPKIVARIPQAEQAVYFSVNKAIERDFDFHCAVDTNTRLIHGKSISVVGILIFRATKIPSSEGLKIFYKFEIPYCLEYVGLTVKPENFGWYAALHHLAGSKLTNNNMRIGLIVDSDLGKINDYNQRKSPIFADVYLPPNVKLIYASADTGKDLITNKAISIADSISAQCLGAIESGKLVFNDEIYPSGYYFERFRHIFKNTKQ